MLFNCLNLLFVFGNLRIQNLKPINIRPLNIIDNTLKTSWLLTFIKDTFTLRLWDSTLVLAFQKPFRQRSLAIKQPVFTDKWRFKLSYKRNYCAYNLIKTRYLWCIIHPRIEVWFNLFIRIFKLKSAKRPSISLHLQIQNKKFKLWNYKISFKKLHGSFFMFTFVNWKKNGLERPKMN